MMHAGRGPAFHSRAAPFFTSACVFAVLTVSPWACNARSPCDGVACAPACPRDSTPDARGRCACVAGELPVLGACVPPAVADSYCGPAARGGPDGCAFRACAQGERLDAVTGACVSEATLPGAGTIACADGGASVVAQGRMTCVATDVACPRGTLRAGATCPRPTVCPPGTLASSSECRTVVTVGKRADRPRVDLGAWSALVFGVDGGEGSPELCRPLALRPDAFGLNQGQQGRVSVQLSVVTPDQDLTLVHAHVRGELTVASGRRPLAGEAAGLIASSVATLVEPLRSLGGEASAGVVELQVSCVVGSL